MFFSSNQGTSKLRHQHSIQIFNCIRQFEPISRVEISNKTKISKPTVSRIITELSNVGLISEIGLDDTTSGRKPIMIVLKKNAYYSIGVFLTRKHIRIALLNLKKEIVNSVEKDIKYVFSSEELLDSIISGIKSILEMKLDTSRILGIGVAIPGLVDNSSGTVLNYGGYKHYNDFKIKEHLENTFGFNVYVDNNANARVLADYWAKDSMKQQNIASVICGSGIGSGIVSHGKIVRGSNNITGEIGHMKVELNGRLCQCGSKGCVEAYASTHAIENIMIEETNKKVSFKQVCDMEMSGNKLAKDVINKAREAISVAISNLILVTNPKIVILSGEFFKHNKSYYQIVIDKTRELCYGDGHSKVKFHYRENDNRINTLGAALLVFEHIFNE